MTYDQLLYNLSHNINFSFSRWGDGEFNCIMQNRPGKTNCDGNLYYPEMGKALEAIVKSGPEYHMGMQPLAETLYPEKAAQFRANGSTWINADILHNASMSEGLDRLWEALANREVLFLGPNHLRGIAWPNYAHMYTPDRNCWDERDFLLRIIDVFIKGNESTVVFICAGMAANYFVDELYKRYGTKHTFIDAGSVFDPYCGVNSRKYHQQIIDREHKRSNTLS